MSTPHPRWPPVAFVPPARHLLRGKDLADARYSEHIDVDDMAGAAGLSDARFSREFRRAFGESPRAYLLTRRLERAAALLGNTDRSVADVSAARSGSRASAPSQPASPERTECSPTAYRAASPPCIPARPDPDGASCASTGVRNAARFEKTDRLVRPASLAGDRSIRLQERSTMFEDRQREHVGARPGRGALRSTATSSAGRSAPM